MEVRERGAEEGEGLVVERALSMKIKVVMLGHYHTKDTPRPAGAVSIFQLQNGKERSSGDLIGSGGRYHCLESSGELPVDENFNYFGKILRMPWGRCVSVGMKCGDVLLGFLCALCPHLCPGSGTPQCLTYPYPSTSPLFASPSHSSSVELGHWPLESSYWCDPIGISLEISPMPPSSITPQLQIFSHASLPSQLLSSWKITPEEFQSPSCEHLFEDILFLPFPYDPSAYQSDGSNYYVIHVDILLPLWNYLRSRTQSPFIILFPFDSKSQRHDSSLNDRDLTTSAFHNLKKYWIHSLQLLSQHQYLVPGDVTGLRTMISHSKTLSNLFNQSTFSSFNSGRICFQNIRLGLPRYDRPSPVSLRRFSQQYREAVLLPSTLFPNLNPQTISNLDREISRHICHTTNISIGLVIREGRRKIRNEDEFISMIQRIGRSWCHNRSMSSRSSGCEIHVSKIFFGKWNQSSATSNIETDLSQIQLLSVLIGIQGSGLINALYLSRFTSVVVYYLNDGWPISSGDPLELLAARGPYIRHINTDPTKVICPLSEDQYCDSGDLIIDEESYAETIVEALNQHQAICDNEPPQPPAKS